MSNTELLERLSAADPARDWVPDRASRDAIWARIAAAPAVTPTRRRRPRWNRRSGALALAAALALTGGALAATDVIRFGKPAGESGAFSHPHRGAGAVLPHSVRLLAVTAPDPGGGPRWGMRVLSTTRGVGCIQVGRVLQGRLGIIGRDHAFGDDGLFHEAPVTSSVNRPDCTNLDANGRMFLSIGVDYMPASGTRSCGPPGFTRGGPPPEPICEPSSQRSLYYGLLGPEARSITYRLHRRTVVRKTAGPEGAFLIVTRAERQRRSDSIAGGLLPSTSPITAIDYKDGKRCNLPRPGRPYPASACKPQGYVPPKQAAVERTDVTAPVRVRVLPSHNARRRAVIEVTFVARVPVTNARSSYIVSWSTGRRPRGFYLLPTQGDIKAGAAIRKRFAVSRAGVYRGTVRYMSPTGPSPGLFAGRPGQGLIVGRYAVRIGSDGHNSVASANK